MKKIIVNGTFDIVHTGHLKLLNYAKSLGDHLTVCIDSDHRVRQLKGQDRPVNDQDSRKFLLENLKAVDEVLLFNTAEELEKIIKETGPYTMVKGSDYKGRPIVGSEYCEEIIFLDLLYGHSTTNIIQRIVQRSSNR